MAEIIEGMDALQKKLQELEYTMQRKVLIEAAKAGGQIVLDDAKSNAPRNTGKLAEGIRMQVKNGESDIHQATVAVGPGRKQFYAGFQERGTKYQKAHPFMAPAVVRNRDRIRDAIRSALRDAIDRVVK